MQTADRAACGLRRPRQRPTAALDIDDLRPGLRQQRAADARAEPLAELDHQHVVEKCGTRPTGHPVPPPDCAEGHAPASSSVFHQLIKPAAPAQSHHSGLGSALLAPGPPNGDKAAHIEAQTRRKDHPNDFRTPRVLRHAADRQPAPRQLSRRAAALGRDAEHARVHLLHRRHARDHGVAEPGRAAPGDPRRDRGLHRRRPRYEEEHHLQPEPGVGARRARLGVQLRRPPRLARPHDAVQGEGRQGEGARLGRPLRLSRR